MTDGNSASGAEERRAPARSYEDPLHPLVTAEPEHFTRVVAPLLVAFTLPTIAVIATTKDLPTGAGEAWRDAVLALLLTTTGSLLAGTQLSVSGLAKVPWSSPVRAVLTYGGLVSLAGALGLLVLPAIRSSPSWMAGPWTVALAILGLGVGVPIGLRIWDWKTRHRLAHSTNHRDRDLGGE